MSRPIRVLVLHASDHEGPRLWDVVTIDGDDYRELVRLVHGNLGSCTLPMSLRRRGYYAYCDDDANVRGDLPAPNGWATHLGQSRLRGPIVIVRCDETGEEQGLEPIDITFWQDYLLGPPSREAIQGAVANEAWWREHPAGFQIESFDNLDDFLKAMGLTDK